jgi:nicotinamide-nucleotide amidase
MVRSLAIDMPMNPPIHDAEVISIGDELTSGERLDTNSQWLSQRLGELGLHVLYHTTVGDDLAANVRVFRQAIERTALVVATGGLGPTADDLTRQALAEAAGVELALDPASLEHIKALFARRQRPMPDSNVVQAMFPTGSRPVPNPHGSAPGIDMMVPRPGGGSCRVFCLPGVPAEMREMWTGTLAAAIAGLGGGRIIRHHRIKCFGAGESELEQMLPDLIRRGRVPSVGITVSGGTITLRITAQGPTADECLAAMRPTIDTIQGCLGNLVFGEEDDELEHALVRQLAAQGKTLATAEGGTAGLIAQRLAAVTGGGDVYLGGIVAPHLSGLAHRAGVAEALTAAGSPVHEAVAVALAQAARMEFDADYGLAISDFPKQDDATAQPRPFFCAIATPQGTQGASYPFAGHPAILKTLAAKRAMNFLRLTLLP